MKTFYTRTNLGRKPQYQITTTILSNNKNKFVKKEAYLPQAEAHIEVIQKNYDKLKKEAAPFQLPKIRKETKQYIEYEFLPFPTLESQLESSLLGSDYENCVEILQHYLTFLQTLKVKSNNPSAFHTAFKLGTHATFKDDTHIASGLIDLNLDNVLFDRGVFYVIDLEWAVDGVLPFSYVKARGLFWLCSKLQGILVSHIQSGLEAIEVSENIFIPNAWIKKLDLTREDFHIFFEWENKFQETVILEPHTFSIIYKHVTSKEFSESLNNAAVEKREEQNKLLEEQNKLLQEINQQQKNDLEKIFSSQTYIWWQRFNMGKRIVKKIIQEPKLFFRKIITILKKVGKNPTALITYTQLALQGKFGLLLHRLQSTFSIEEDIKAINYQYKKWRKARLHTPLPSGSSKPLISILMPTYKSNTAFLKEAIDSVRNQTYQHWQLCIVDDDSQDEELRNILLQFEKDDERILVTFLSKNSGIGAATHKAFKVSSGEYIGLLDHDDVLEPHALASVVNVLNKNSEADFIYSDEDKLSSEEIHVEPYFKPDWSPNLLLSLNYITHFAVIKRSLIEKVGGISSQHDGSQDYDLFLKTTEQAQRIVHIPDILYSWRKVPGSTADKYASKGYANTAAIRSLQDALDRRNVQGEVEEGVVPGTFRVRYAIKNTPKVSIIIPSKDNIRHLRTAVNSIILNSTYKNYEIIIVDTGSQTNETLSYLKEVQNDQIYVLHWKQHFNYAAVNNYAVSKASGEYIVLFNDDVEVITPDWIESLLEHAQRETVGAVGAKLLYPDKSIQHAGIVLGIRGGDIKKGIAGHILKRHSDVPLGLPLFNIKDVVRDVSAVTAACLMVSKKKYQEVHGMNEAFRIAFNDVDFNLKLLKKGYQNIYTPYAVLYHHESVSVGLPTKGTRDLREFAKEIQYMHELWGDTLQKDRFYNKHYSLKDEHISIQYTQ